MTIQVLPVPAFVQLPFVFLVFTATAAANAVTVTVTGLALEDRQGQVDGVDIPDPRFSWQLAVAAGDDKTGGRGVHQTSFALQVARADPTFAPGSLVMDLAADGPATTHVAFNGTAPLASAAFVTTSLLLEH